MEIARRVVYFYCEYTKRYTTELVLAQRSQAQAAGGRLPRWNGRSVSGQETAAAAHQLHGSDGMAATARWTET